MTVDAAEAGRRLLDDARRLTAMAEEYVAALGAPVPAHRALVDQEVAAMRDALNQVGLDAREDAQAIWGVLAACCAQLPAIQRQVNPLAFAAARGMMWTFGSLVLKIHDPGDPFGED